MARPGDVARTFFAEQVADADAVIVCHGFHDEVGGNRFVVADDDVLQRAGGQVDVDNVAFFKAAAGNDAVQRAFQFAHAGFHVLGDKQCRTFVKPDVHFFGFVFQNVDTHFQFGRFDAHGHAPGEARNQPFFHVFQSAGQLVAGQNDLLVARMKMLEQEEEFFHGAVFALNELDVVDDEQVVVQILLFERVPTFVFHGGHEGFQVFVRVHIAHFGGRIQCQQAVAHGLHQVGFTQAGGAVHEKRVVHIVARVFSNAHRHLHGQLVALAHHQRVKRVFGRQVGLRVALFRGFALFLLFDGGGGVVLYGGRSSLHIGGGGVPGRMVGAQVVHALLQNGGGAGLFAFFARRFGRGFNVQAAFFFGQFGGRRCGKSSLHIGICHRARCPAADFVAHGRCVGRKFRLQCGNLRRVLRTQQIHGELVFGIQHPCVILLAQRDGGNGAVELLFAQFRMKAAQRLRPKIS